LFFIVGWCNSLQIWSGEVQTWYQWLFGMHGCKWDKVEPIEVLGGSNKTKTKLNAKLSTNFTIKLLYKLMRHAKNKTDKWVFSF
jgi:hypothetical protein